MVANYAEGKRRFDCYPAEADALEAAQRLARKLSEREVVAASLTNEDASNYAAAVQALARHNVSLPTAAAMLAECLRLGGSLPGLLAASKDYARRHPAQLPQVRVADAVAQFLEAKRKDNLRDRSIGDLSLRLNRFGDAFQKAVANVSSPDLADWLDSLDLGPQSRLNYRRVLNNFFGWCEGRGLIARGENPVVTLPEVKMRRDQAITIYTPEQLHALLTAAEGEYLTALALLAFAGMRPDEVWRLDWQDANLAEGFIHVTGRGSKTRTHRHVPVLEPLGAWLAPHSKPSGKVWSGTANQFTVARRGVVKASGVKWLPDALRHTWISCRLALVGNTAQVALEAGNSEQVIVRHYRHLRTERQARAWFDIAPVTKANVVNMPAAAVA